MGKLAERLSDERRSGVYRIEVTEALEEAMSIAAPRCTRVALHNASQQPLLHRCAAAMNAGTATTWDAVAAALGERTWAHPAGDVVLITGVEALGASAAAALAPLMAALRDAAAAHRLRGARFFGVFLDPGRLLPLDPLYDRRRHAAAPASAVLYTRGGAQ